MRSYILCETLVSLMIGLSVGAAAPAAEGRDGSCTGLLATKAQQAPKGQWYSVELTMHREGVKLVSYSTGFLAPNPDGSFTGRANQLFSDRTVGEQVFNAGAADQLDLQLSRTGLLRIHYSPWNFDTSWDLSCKGSMLTTYLPGFGIVTLTFRDLFTPIQ